MVSTCPMLENNLCPILVDLNSFSNAIQVLLTLWRVPFCSRPKPVHSRTQLCCTPVLTFICSKFSFFGEHCTYTEFPWRTRPFSLIILWKSSPSVFTVAPRHAGNGCLMPQLCSVASPLSFLWPESFLLASSMCSQPGPSTVMTLSQREGPSAAPLPS